MFANRIAIGWNYFFIAELQLYFCNVQADGTTKNERMEIGLNKNSIKGM